MICHHKANYNIYIFVFLMYWPSVDLMLNHRLRRWPNIKSTLG